MIYDALTLADLAFVLALHKKSWAVIDRPYSLGSATVGALYERPRSIFCAKPFVLGLSGGIVMAVVAWRAARQYARARESIRRISRRPFREPTAITEREMSDV